MNDASPQLERATPAESSRRVHFSRASRSSSRARGTSSIGNAYANLFPNRIRAMVFDGTMDFAGNATGRDGNGSTVPLDTRQDVATGIADTFARLSGTGLLNNFESQEHRWLPRGVPAEVRPALERGLAMKEAEAIAYMQDREISRD